MSILASLAPSAMNAVRGASILDHPITVDLPLPLCLVRFDVDAFHPDMFSAASMARPDRIARSVHKRQAEYFFGRLAARAAMVMRFHEPCDVPIGEQREPIWPDGMTGSISHVEGLAAATVVPRDVVSGVGIDIEVVVNSEEMKEAIAATAIDDQEFAYLKTLQGDHFDMHWLLTLAFSAKEALFKGAFGAVGRYFDFSAARLHAIDIQRGVLELVLRETLSGEFQESRICQIGYRVLPDDVLLTGFVW